MSAPPEAGRGAGRRARRSGFRTDIQGLRAIAVLLVVVYHAGVSAVSGGFIGVDVFFVISGYLITSHLVSGLEAGTFRLRDFWARRIRRLIPAAWAVAALTLVVGLLWFPRLLVPQLLKEAGATFAYVPNVLFAVWGTDYLSNDTPSVYQHYWSLGVEEQFYVVWPLLLMLAFTLFRRSRKLLLLSVVAATATSFVLGVWMTQWREPLAFFLLPTRAWELGAGALVAIVVLMAPAFLSSTSRFATVWRAVAGGGGLALVLGPAFIYDALTPFPGWQAALPVVGTALVILAGTNRGSRSGIVQTMLSLPPLQFFGRISYSLYLVHWPLLIATQTIVGWQHRLPLAMTAGLAVLAVPLAWLCYRFVEVPGQARTRWWYASAWRPISVAALTAAIFAAAAYPVAGYIGTLPMSSTRSASAVPLTKHPIGTSYVPSNMKPTLNNAGRAFADDSKGCLLDAEDVRPGDCRYGDDPQAPLVVLFGDSHAFHWRPALVVLADEGKIRLQIHAKRACRSAEVPSLGAACAEWRNAAIAQINQAKPALVLFANFSASPDNGTPEQWRSALMSTIERIGPRIPTAVVEDVGEQPVDPAMCLSQHLDDADACSSPRDVVINGAMNRADREAAARTGSGFVEVDDYLCSDLCPLIIGNQLVQGDRNHVTVPFSRTMAPVFDAFISGDLAKTKK